MILILISASTPHTMVLLLLLVFLLLSSLDTEAWDSECTINKKSKVTGSKQENKLRAMEFVWLCNYRFHFQHQQLDLVCDYCLTDYHQQRFIKSSRPLDLF
mmetsp:Transcript_31896/g.77305  ORF Transcript_31896/g.77305 Transcript_31896/m.77305 type:complete len:101 (-) Transcript_31896:29-331(-)